MSGTSAFPVDHDATVIEVAKFRRRTEPAISEDDGGEDWPDETTLVLDAPVVAPPDDGDATVIEAVPAPLAPAQPTPPAPQPAVPLAELFAEPPALPRHDTTAIAAPVDRRRRKRNLMLACTVLAGAWVTMRPAAPSRPVTSRILEVRPAAAQRPPARLPSIATPASVDVRAAATALASSRYAEALAHYRELAVRHPDQPVYAVIAGILANELEDRCLSRVEEGCQ